MLNDRSSILSFLKTRRSVKPRDLVDPAPTPDEIGQMLEIASRTPDHGRLAPWRFVIVSKDQRDALGALLRRALVEHDPCATIAHHQKEDEFAHYPGALVVLVSAPVRDHKIPVWEQELSSGAAGMNLVLAAHALGYVAGWVTGWRAYSPRVEAAFCGAGERIAGFIFIGTAGQNIEERVRPSVADIARQWQLPTP